MTRTKTTTELASVRIEVADLERYRAWCSIQRVQVADGVGVLLNILGVPSLEELQEFVKPKNNVFSPLQDEE